ncbi:MAG: DUF2855 family protein [Rubrivivax sp.]
MTPTSGHRLLIARTDLPDVRLGPDPDAPSARPLQPGQARLQIEGFALTANNITYAAFGDAMKYWQFFPSGDAGRGCLPVWGFATAVESQVDGVAPGRRIWGCFPAGTHLVVAPGKVSAHGFADAALHRLDLALVYRQYAFCDADPAWQPDLEGLQALLRPLFITAFLLDDFLADNDFFGAEQLLLSSASSKTAFATAACLAERRGATDAQGRPPVPRIVGLTSAGNRAFAQSLGCYGEVRLYDELDAMPAATRSVYVDFAGNASLRRAVHCHFGDALAYSSSIGGTHWDALGSGRDLPGPRPVLFFAPAQVKLRSAPPPEGWGGAELQQRIASAWTRFIGRVKRGGWVQVIERGGAQAALQAYGEMLAGRSDAREGLMLDMR